MRRVEPLTDARITALVLAHDANATGGVNNFLRIMRSSYRARVAAMRFINGPRKGGRHRRHAITRMIQDYVRFVGLLIRRRFDILHLNPSLDLASTPRELVFAALCMMLRPSTRLLIFYRGWSWDAFDAIRTSFWKRRLFLAINRRAGCILVLAPSFRSALIQIGLGEDQVQLSSTMFEGRAFAPLLGHDPKAAQQILFLSRFLVDKGGAELLEAFANLIAQAPGWTLVMAGDGPDRARLEGIRDRLQLQPHVSFPGYVNVRDKVRILGQSSIFVLPTRHGEGMPNAILEAMAAGHVIISSDVGGIGDIVKDGVNGTLLRSTDPAAIESALKLYVDDQFERVRIGTLNQRTTWANWESSIVSDRMADTYYTMLHGRAARDRQPAVTSEIAHSNIAR